MTMSVKAKKALNIVVDAIVLIILAIAIIFAVSMISSRASGYEGYTVIFGKSYLAVQTNSMAGDGEDNFSAGDLIIIRTVDTEEAQSLEEGTIITFRTNEITEDDHYVLNTHRIQQSNNGWYVTHGDNNPDSVTETVLADNVVGVYEGKIEGLGNFVLFMSSFGGFCTFVLVPSLLVVIYFAVNLVLVIKKEKAKQTAESAIENEKLKAEEKERMRQEILAELAKEGTQATAVQPSDDEGGTDGQADADGEE